MAGNTGGEKYIGKLMLDISEVQKQITEVNTWLGKIGANINLEDTLSKKTSAALQKLVNEAKKAGEEAQKAITNPAQSNGENEELKKAIKLWKEYYELMSKAQQAKNSGKENQAAFYEKEANSIIASVKALKEEAEAIESVAKAKRSYNAAVEAGKDKEASKAAAAAAKEQAKAQKELEKAQKEAAQAAKDENTAVESRAAGLSSHMKNATSEVRTFGAEVNKQGQAVETLVSTVTTGFDKAGNKIKETANSQGQIVKRTEETKASITALISLYDQQHQKQAQMFELEQKGETNTSKYAKLKEELAAINERIGQYSQSVQTAARQTKEFDDILTKYGHTIKGIRTGTQMEEDNKRTAEAIRLWKEYYQLLTKAQQAQNNNNQNQAAFYEKEAQAVRNKANALKREAEVTQELVKVKRDYNAARAAGQDKKEEQTAQNIANIRQRIVGVLHQQKQAHQGIVHDLNKEAENYDEIGSQISGMLTRLISIYTVIRGISTLVHNTVDYVSQYYDKMNEIQIITQKSNEEVAQLAETYRDIAEEMNVSSLDMADAAIYFTRQGLAAEEIEKRLKNVTMYAKTANVEFNDASEIITAVVNSMGLVEQEAEDGRNAAQRVADVFLKVGDSAATSGQEIGEAMQKAAASAGAFGMSLEWLTAYIATVSETTRQEARTIGTAFNTIIARLHQIKQQGYNSEDETKINDVQKALANVGITLMDNNNEWRDMDTIFQEIGAKWDELDGKTKSYIATTMAGVKQQNVFLALMNDLAKSTEGESRAMQLYTAAINSNGTAEQKYATWTDSVAAAQERLNIAQEKFYSLLDASVIKNWNNFLAGFVNLITEGTEKTKGFNIILTALIGIGAGVIATIVLAKAELISLNAILVTLSHHPIVIILAAVAAAATLAVTAFSALGSVFSNATERFEEASKAMSDSMSKIDRYLASQKQVGEMFDELSQENANTNNILEQYGDLLDGLTDISPRAKAAVLDLKNGLIDQSQAAEILNEELEKVIEKEKKIGTIELIKYLRNYEGQTGTNLEFVKKYQKWDSEWFEGEYNHTGFTKALEKAFNNWNLGIGDIFGAGVLTQPQAKEINDMLQQGLSWDNIATLFWDKFVNGSSYNPAKLLKEKIMDMVQTTMDTIGQDLDHIDRTAYQNKLLDFLFDTDGELKVETLDEAKNAILSFVGLFADDRIEITPSDRSSVWLDNIFGSLLGKDPKKTVLDRLESLGIDRDLTYGLLELMENWSDKTWPEITRMLEDQGFDKNLAYAIAQVFRDGAVDPKQEILDQLSELGLDEDFAYGLSKIIEEGIDPKLIRSMLNSLPVEKWGNLYEEMQAKLLSIISNKAGAPLHNVDSDGNIDMMMWDQLNLSTLNLIYNLMDAGTALSDIKKAMGESSSLDEFIAKLKMMAQGLGLDAEDAEDYKQKIKELTAEIDKLNKMIDNLKNGKPVDFEDLLNMADAHPEIMAVIHDTESLLAVLERLKREDTTKAINVLKNTLYNNADFAKESGFEVNDGESLQMFKKRQAAEGIDTTYIDKYVDQVLISFLATTDRLNTISKDVLAEWMNSMFSDSNVDLLHRKAVQVGDDIATVLTETITASADGHEGVKWNENLIINLTPITPDGQLLDEDTFYEYVDDLLAKSANVDDLYYNDKVKNGGKGLLISALSGFSNEDFEQLIQSEAGKAELLHKLQEAYYGVSEAAETWLETQLREFDLSQQMEWAKSNGFIEQIRQLQDYLGDESIDGAAAALDLWNSFDESMRKSIVDTYPGILKAMAQIEDEMDKTERDGTKLTETAKNLGKSLEKAAKTATAQNFKKTYEAIQKLEKGTISAADAFDTFYSETDKITKAQEEINTATDKMADGVELAVSDVNDLAGVLGISADQILQDFPGAVDMFNQLIGQTGDLRAAFDALNEAAFIRITGVSEADFSAIENGLFAVRSDAEDVIKLLEATGQWEVVPIELPQEAKVWDPFSKTYTTVKTAGSATVLKATGNNPYKGTNKSNYSGSNKKSGGGGGNKNNDSNQMTEVELMLNRMEQMQNIIESQQGFYQAQSNYYKQTGHLQGVIGYSQKEIQVLEAQNDVLKQNIEQIDKYRQQKEAELEALDVSDEKYEEVRDDLDKLQKAHQQYTKQVIENETAIDQLNETIKETQKQIRDMQIKIREQIYKAIEDREKKAKNMLQNEITMENTILDIIKRKYEIERDKIIENTEARITALQEEKDLLSEQLRIRKEMAEEEDKAAKLAQLEANYNRIVADPTRAKEAKKIQDEINALRKEMAWDAAEKEVKAQQDSIDQQVTSLEDYKQYIEEYYEDLFEHPAKLIEEMRNIITRTDDEILDWLKQNSEEYAASSENTQHQMVNTWSDTLDEMRGRIKTYWDEVEEIIAGGDDKIVQFLIDNSEDYARAGKLQAEKYVDEWREELEDLHKALEDAFTIDAPEYVVMDPSTGVSSGGSGSGGGGSGGGGNKDKDTTEQKTKKWHVHGTDQQGRQTAFGVTYDTEKQAKDAVQKAQKQGWTNLSISQYKRGGIADFTGPAWLDGTKQDPERILSPYQTKLFESMVQALEKMSTISIPSMPNFGNPELTGSGGVNVGDIIVNVDNLDTDDDYEELAEKVSEVLMERIGRTTVVGGLRINS